MGVTGKILGKFGLQEVVPWGWGLPPGISLIPGFPQIPMGKAFETIAPH